MTVTPRSTLLVLGAAASAAAALAHVGCIAFGAPWYRFFGAGERMARMAERGHWYPTVVTLGITVVLVLWTLYSLSGAGVIRRLPALRPVLCAITLVYLARGLLVLPFWRLLPHRNPGFWLWSSAICVAIGAVHLAGLAQSWTRLGNAAPQPAIERPSRATPTGAA